MQSEVSVRLADDQGVSFRPDQRGTHGARGGRRWLDDQFTALDCEPLRASGKVLLADKVLTVAQAAGAHLLARARVGPGICPRRQCRLGQEGDSGRCARHGRHVLNAAPSVLGRAFPCAVPAGFEIKIAASAYPKR